MVAADQASRLTWRAGHSEKLRENGLHHEFAFAPTALMSAAIGIDPKRKPSTSGSTGFIVFSLSAMIWSRS
jgi:hypothetical protein